MISQIMIAPAREAIFSVIFCYHLKQSYIIVAFIPLITATIISIVRQHTKKNILYRSGTLLLSLFFFFTSLIAWNTILQRMGVDMDTGRDSSSMLSQQLLKAYQITYDQDSDGKNDPLSTMDAIGVLFRDFISNPTHITSTYVRNYCGLTSVCVISSDDTVDYISTFDFNGLETFENTTIGYRPYSVSPSIFEMTDSLYSNASIYGDSTNRSLIQKSQTFRPLRPQPHLTHHRFLAPRIFSRHRSYHRPLCHRSLCSISSRHLQYRHLLLFH